MGGPAPSVQRAPPSDDRSATPPGPAAPGDAAPSGYFPGVEPGALDAVRDNKPVGVAEWGAWLHLFDVLQHTDQATLRRKAAPVTYVQLLQQSSDYRGELVTMRGIVRRAHPAKTPRNEYGLTDYYQAWLWPSDHPQDPVVVWSLHLPEGFPIGMEVAEPVEVTGFHFKIFVYKSADGLVRRAPMLLAGNVRWTGAGSAGRGSAEAAGAPALSARSLALLIGGAAGLAVLVAAIVYVRTRRAAPEREDTPPDEDALRQADAGPGVAALQQLAEEAKSADDHT
jgi:hypothetical protein